MNITLFSRDKIEAGLDHASSNSKGDGNKARLLFAPQKITERNFDAVCKAYSQIGPDDFKTVVVVESTPGEAEKKLAMPSFKVIESNLGQVPANEKLRNDFADEDDDFFINDHAFDDRSGLFQQLPILQCRLNKFSVLHIQITDERPPIIKELATALQEILPSRHALLVCCCDRVGREEIDHLRDLLDDGNFSGLMNRVNRGVSKIQRVGSLTTGLLVAKTWGLRLNFEYDTESGAVQSGYGVIQNQPIFG